MIRTKTKDAAEKKVRQRARQRVTDQEEGRSRQPFGLDLLGTLFPPGVQGGGVSGGVFSQVRHGEAQPGLAGRIVFAWEPMQGQVTGRDRPSLPVDRIEVLRPRQAVPALHSRAGAQAERRLRPLARRRFRIICPARVDMRARKPCFRLRRRTLGWYVRFTGELSWSVDRGPQCADAGRQYR